MACETCDKPARRTFERWRSRFLTAGVACALALLSVSFGLSYMARDITIPDIFAYAWVMLALASIASFFTMLVCAALCRGDRWSLRQVAVALGSISVMVSMYIYCPWFISDTEEGRIAYAPIWSPSIPRIDMLDGVFLDIGRLLDQYMLVVIAGSLLSVLFMRKERSLVSGEETPSQKVTLTQKST